jgi:hypothetical protein
LLLPLLPLVILCNVNEKELVGYQGPRAFGLTMAAGMRMLASAATRIFIAHPARPFRLRMGGANVFQ